MIAFALNMISLVVINPYFADTPHIAENSLNFYYLTRKYGVLEALTKMEAGYLPLLQRLIAILYIKVFHMGTNALYFMQFTGALIDNLMVCALNLYTFRGKTHRSVHFALSICIFLLFMHPVVSTFFNFIYLGFVLIGFLLTCDLDELKRYQFVLLCIFAGIICMSKGLYAAALPVGIVEIILFRGVAGRRKNIYAAVIALTAAIELGYAFLIGGTLDRWGLAITMPILCSLKTKYIVIAVASMCIAVGGCCILVKMWKNIGVGKKQKYMNCVLLMVLFGASLFIETVARRYFSIDLFLNWANWRYVPAEISLILLLDEIIGAASMRAKRSECVILILAGILLSLQIAAGFYHTKNSIRGSYLYYDCTSWSTYKSYFDETIVPVFQYDQRFGTLTDGYTLWYTADRPVDNYIYGAPYDFAELWLDCIHESESRNYVSVFQMGGTLYNQSLSAIYLNYTNNVGNAKLQLLLYDSDGNYIDTLQQVSPMSSKTIGFIADEPIIGVSRVEIMTEDGEAAYVTKNAYFITKEAGVE